MTILAQIAHIIRLFLKKGHFLVRVFLGNFFMDIGQLLTQAFWSPWMQPQP